MKILKFSIVISVLFYTNLFAQLTQQWATRFNGYINATSSKVARDSQGNIYVSGSDSNRICFLLIKYNSNGDTVWTRKYTGNPERRTTIAAGLGIDPNDNVIISGEWGGWETDDIVTIKYNSSGDELWVNHYDGPNMTPSMEWGRDLVLDDQGNAYAVGFTAIGSDKKGVIIKIDNSNGSLIWERLIEEENTTSLFDFYQVKKDDNGFIYMTGSRSFQGSNFTVTAKYDSDGNQQWIKKYKDFGYSSEFNGMYVNSSGNVYITGSNGIDFMTIVYNSSGNLLWYATYDGSSSSTNDFARSVISDNSGNVYVTGQSIESGVPSLSLIKYDIFGTQQWVRIFSGSTPSEYTDGRSLALDGNGNIYICGAIWTNGLAHSKDQKVLVYSPSGRLLENETYDGSGDDGFGDWLNPILVDNDNNVYVTLESEHCSSCQNLDVVTIKYSQSSADNKILTLKNQPLKFEIQQNYPNPFNPITDIKFTISNSAKGNHTQLIIYNIIGQKITTLVDQQIQPGTYEVEWDASNYPSGIYYYKLISGSFNETKKMVLIK